MLRFIKRYGHHCVSIVVIVSLLTQVLLPIILHPPTAQAAPLSTNQPQISSKPLEIRTQITQLEQALRQLEETDREETFNLALNRVQSTWNGFLFAEEQTRQTLASTQQNLASQNLQEAHARQTALLADYKRHISDLITQYESLINIAQTDRQAAQQAASSLRLTLAASIADPAPQVLPDLDALSHRPVDNPGPVKQVPPLSSAILNMTQAQMRTLAVPGRNSPATIVDMIATEDAEITPEIQTLADRLGRDREAIYEYVYNSIAFEPYYGSRKGALLTLWERSGNDVDIANLLIALLRASGYPARYVRGTIAIDEAEARNWLKNAPDLDTAAQILSTGGISVSVTSDKKFLIKEHAWVEIDASAAPTPFTIFLPMVLKGANASPIQSEFAPSINLNADWVALDASFKQFNYYESLNTAAITGFDAEQWIDDVRPLMTIDDSTRTVSSIPTFPSPQFPDDDEYDVGFVDSRADEAAAQLIDYIESNPNLTNVDLLGGGYIVTKTVTALPDSLPYMIVTDQPVTEYSELPPDFREYLTVEIYTGSGTLDISHKASLPSLANKRITVSYEAATPGDQATIDSYGGALLNTPPIVNLVPVLRIDGIEIARGSPADMGRTQTRSLTLTDANGNSHTAQNIIRVGETYAIGLAYGRSSAAALEASQTRLAAARNQIPTDTDGYPDVNAPENMGEPVIGESLHMALTAYFNQLDTYSELISRKHHLSWERYSSAGVAIQGLAFSYFFGAPVETLGGGLGFDIQLNILGVISLQDNPDDERVFFKTTGVFSSAIENSIFENIGFGSVSTIRLLELALERGVPVHRIDSSNKAAVFPLLKLSSSIENYISTAINQGKIVTVSEDEITVNDWVGVGFIVTDPASGAAGYLISGGLAGNITTLSGGATWDIFQENAAFAWAAINLGLDFWGVWAGIALLVVPEPTLLTKIAGVGLIVANLVALGFDVADLMKLASGDKAASEYIGENITGLIIQAILNKTGLAAVQKLVDKLPPELLNKITKQYDKLTDGAVDRLSKKGFSDAELTEAAASKLTTREGWQGLDRLAAKDAAAARRILDNEHFNRKGAVEDVIRAADNAPDAPGLDRTIDLASKGNNFGVPYELTRAAANEAAGNKITEYGKRVDVTFQRVIAVNDNGVPTLGDFATQPLEGDFVSGNIWFDAKHGPVGNKDTRIWDQIQKAQAAINAGLIDEFRFEGSSSIGKQMRDWAAINAPGVKFEINLGDGFR